MNLKLEKFNKILENKNLVETYLEKTKKEYRKLDPGQYLYNLMLDKRKIFDIYSDEYLELVYTTLIAWNMNGRGAKLADISEFKETIRKNKEDINLLKGYRIEKLDKGEVEKILKILEKLFEKMIVVQTKSPLVTFSKTLHFLIPELIVPIDRRYTSTFFYNSNQLPSQEKQFKVFSEIFEKFWELSKKHNLDNYIDHTWNRTIPKIMDNIIIGYKLNNK